MKTETKQALRAALGTPAFAGVRAALVEEENDAFEHATQTGRLGSTLSVAQCWRNDRWQAAWREMLRNLTAITGTDPKVRTQHENWVAKIDQFNEPCFCSIVGGVDTWLTGDDLAAALRDYALEESCKK